MSNTFKFLCRQQAINKRAFFKAHEEDIKIHKEDLKTDCRKEIDRLKSQNKRLNELTDAINLYVDNELKKEVA